jgi:hypothetical protein
MRRATAAALGTVIGTALLVAAKYAAPSATAGPATAITAGDPAAVGSGGPGSSLPAAAASGPSGAPTQPSGAARTTAAPPPPCKTTSGSGISVESPGIGTVTVTIKVCNGVISSASSTQSQSNWENNGPALPALNSLTPQYYKTNISAIHYSGATLTSKAYRLSLQSAMTKAGV